MNEISIEEILKEVSAKIGDLEVQLAVKNIQVRTLTEENARLKLGVGNAKMAPAPSSDDNTDS
jgi:hypothetical protein